MNPAHEYGYDNLFRRLRLSTGLNQTQFAQKIGTTQQTVSRIEKGKSSPSADLFLKICAAAEADLTTRFYMANFIRGRRRVIRRAA